MEENNIVEPFNPDGRSSPPNSNPNSKNKSSSENLNVAHESLLKKMSGKIWDEKISWDTRKEKAINAINAIKIKNDLYSAAYNDDYEKFKENIINDNYYYKNKSFDNFFTEAENEVKIQNYSIKYDIIYSRNNELLTPLIFGIWGYVDRKNTTEKVKCLDLILKLLAFDLKNSYKIGKYIKHLAMK